MLAHLALELFEHRTGLLHGFTRGLFGGEALPQGLAGVRQFLLERRAITDGALTVLAQTTAKRFVLFPLFLGALLAHGRAALALLADGEFALQPLRLVALLGGEAREFQAARFGGGTRTVRFLAQPLGVGDGFFPAWDVQLQCFETAIERREFVAPRRHFACGQRDLDLEAACRQLGVPFSTTTLTRE
jgi:hypothetical protein